MHWFPNRRPYAAALFAAIVAAGCTDPSPLSHVEETTLLMQIRRSAGERAIRHPVSVDIPFEERVHFDPNAPSAVGYQLAATRGRRYPVWITPVGENGPQAATVVVSVFDLNTDSNAPPQLIAETVADSGPVFVEPNRDGDLLVRLQPAPLTGGTFHVTITVEPAFRFPVRDRDRWSVISVFGQPREGGRRIHEGIDIAGPDGTDVFAVTDAEVLQTGTSPRGGITLTLIDRARELLLYYAHLQEVLVEPGDVVDEGEPVAKLGHSGNASAALPHLHFGIYDYGWSYPINPWPFLVAPNGRDVREQTARGAAPPATADRVAVAPTAYGEWVRTFVYVPLVESSPGVAAQIGGYDNGDLATGTALRLAGATAGRLRLIRPDTLQTVYLRPDQVEPIDRPIGTALVKTNTDTFAAPPADLGPHTVDPPAVGTVEIGEYPLLGRCHDYRLIADNEKAVWIRAR